MGHFVATFIGGKAALAGETGAAAADGVTLLTLPGVDHLVFAEAAKRAGHGVAEAQLTLNFQPFIIV